MYWCGRKIVPRSSLHPLVEVVHRSRLHYRNSRDKWKLRPNTREMQRQRWTTRLKEPCEGNVKWMSHHCFHETLMMSCLRRIPPEKSIWGILSLIPARSEEANSL